MKGQVAIEYLVTYGWAMLVLLIIMALIYTSGIFSPGYFISEQCDIGPKFPCSHFLTTDNGNLILKINLNNGFEHTVQITDVEVTNLDRDVSMDIAGNSFLLPSGDRQEIIAKLQDANPAKQARQNFKVTIRYYSCAPEVNRECTTAAKHVVTGRIIAKVN